MTSRTNLLPDRAELRRWLPSRGRQKEHEEAVAAEPAGRGGLRTARFEDQIDKMSIITGTPKTVIPKIRHVLEYLRPGNIFFWDGDGAMTHDDAMRSLRLMGEEVIPAVREMGKSLDLNGPFEMDVKTNKPVEPASV